MKKRISGKKLKRTTNERKHLWQGLVIELVLRGRIITTETKAKYAKRMAEKLVTKARKGTVFAHREIMAMLPNKEVVKRLMLIGKQFEKRPGGYIRFLKMGNRKGDNAPQALLEWVEQIVEKSSENNSKKTKSSLQKKETKKDKKS